MLVGNHSLLYIGNSELHFHTTGTIKAGAVKSSYVEIQGTRVKVRHVHFTESEILWKIEINDRNVDLKTVSGETKRFSRRDVVILNPDGLVVEQVTEED